jgi:hypothetical protein
MKKCLSYIACMFVLLGCANSKDEFNDIVLKIGNVSITKYEFEKNYRAFLTADRNNTISLNKKREWINTYVDKIYFLADAYKKGYLKDKRIDTDVERMAKHIITQPYGLYEEKTLFNDIKITEDEIEEICSKRNQQINDGIRKNITDELMSKKKAELRQIHMEELKKKLNIAIDNNMVNKFINILQNDKQYTNNNRIDKTLFAKEYGTLFNYNENGKQRQIRVNEFIDYFNNCILKYPLKDEKSIRFYIESMPVEELYYQNALKIGLDKEIKYKMDKRNYRNNVIYYYYEKECLTNKIQIADNELLDFYHGHINLFKDSNELKITSFYFNTADDAEKGRSILQKSTGGNFNNEINNLIKNYGLVDYKIGEKINNDKLFQINKIIDNLNADDYSKPIEINGKYLIIKKENTHGIQISPFPDVKDEIKEMIFEKKLSEIKAVKLSEIKQEFGIKDNIDYTGYLK